MTYSYIIGVALLAFAQAATAQVPAHPEFSAQPVFEVVSIRPSDPSSSGTSSRPTPNGLTVTGDDLKSLIMYAYNIHHFQIEGIPNWALGARFDIVAKIDLSAKSAVSQDWSTRQRLLELRLQALLADRFKLRIHKETKEMSVYQLVVAKRGPKLKMSTANTGYMEGSGEFRCSATSMEGLAEMLSSSTDRIVLDQTHLPDDYEFVLRWLPQDSPDADSSLPGLYTALQEQLGLKLVPAKGAVEIVHIDHVEMPSPN